MSFGWSNPFPFQLGGAPTETELAYRALRRAHGQRVGAGLDESAFAPPDGLADLEMKCAARAIASAAVAVEHALWEAFPDTMTDALPAWERMLLLAREPTDPLRRAAVAAAVTRLIDASEVGLGEALQRIRSQLYLDALPWNLSTTTMRGKDFGPLAGAPGEPYRTGAAAIALFGHESSWPVYADSFVCRVRYVLSEGEVTMPIETRRAALAHLLETLPGWVPFEVYSLSDGDDGEGFYFDGGPDEDSFFDVTALGLV